MSIKGYKERFDGKYNAIVPKTLLPKGYISGGKNMRKVSSVGGWKPRKGYNLINTTTVKSGAQIDSLHYYKNPYNLDDHLIVQVDNDLLDKTSSVEFLITEGSDLLITESGEILLYEGGGGPLKISTDLGSSMLPSGGAVGTDRGFSAVAGEDFFYADGSGRPVVFGGDAPRCNYFLVYDSSEDAYIDYSEEVRDGSLDTEAILLTGASDKYYVGATERIQGLELQFGSVVNTQAATLSVKAWRNSWSAVVNLSDNTNTTQTHDTTGQITWNRSANDVTRVLNGIMAYWYEISFSAAIDAVEINSCKVIRDAEYLTNKWDGLFEWPTGILFYDQSDDEYIDKLGDLTDEASTTYLDLNAATTSDFIYIKAPEPITGIGITMDAENANDSANAGNVDQIEAWTAAGWTANTSIIDETYSGTASFVKTGTIWFDAAALSPVKRLFQGDPVEGYWYRVSWDAALAAQNIYITEILYAAYPEELRNASGVVEFNGRLYIWGDPIYPNKLRYSAAGKPSVFSGEDSGYTDTFGGDENAITCAVKLYDYLVVFKEQGAWTYDREANISRVADRVGLLSPSTAQVIEIGLAGMKRDDLVSVLLWQSADGVYALDGVKPKKVSDPISNYFDPEYSDYLGENVLKRLAAFPDHVKNEYHLLIPDGELVYNYKQDEWYPKWEREENLNCGLAMLNDKGRPYTIGGTFTGFACKLEEGVHDRDTSNKYATIEHSLSTRAIAADPDESTTFRYTLRKIWAEFKAKGSGNASVSIYKDTADDVTDTGTISFTDTTRDMVTGHFDTSIENCETIEFTFSNSEGGKEMEIWSILYEVDVVGELKL